LLGNSVSTKEINLVVIPIVLCLEVTFVNWEGRVDEMDLHILRDNADCLRHYRKGSSDIMDIFITVYHNHCRRLLL
jgi:hypothetical protein